MKPIKYFIVNGYPHSGKDTFSNYCQLYLSAKGWDAHTISSVDFVKKIALKCGWDGQKRPEDRKFLSDLKELLINWGDVPLKKVEEDSEQIRKINEQRQGILGTVIFVMVREPEEIKKFVHVLGAEAIFIERKCDEKLSNDSDKNVENYDYDYYINNDNGLDLLAETANIFCENQILS